jgi:hypothetical protein
MVLVPLNHPDTTEHMLSEPLRTVCKRHIRIIPDAVRLDVGFINEIETVLVAQFVETFGLRVMRSTDSR